MKTSSLSFLGRFDPPCLFTASSPSSFVRFIIGGVSSFAQSQPMPPVTSSGDTALRSVGDDNVLQFMTGQLPSWFILRIVLAGILYGNWRPDRKKSRVALQSAHLSPSLQATLNLAGRRFSRLPPATHSTKHTRSRWLQSCKMASTLHVVIEYSRSHKPLLLFGIERKLFAGRSLLPHDEHVRAAYVHRHNFLFGAICANHHRQRPHLPYSTY